MSDEANEVEAPSEIIAPAAAIVQLAPISRVASDDVQPANGQGDTDSSSVSSICSVSSVSAASVTRRGGYASRGRRRATPAPRPHLGSPESSDDTSDTSDEDDNTRDERERDAAFDRVRAHLVRGSFYCLLVVVVLYTHANLLYYRHSALIHPRSHSVPLRPRSLSSMLKRWSINPRVPWAQLKKPNVNKVANST